MPQTSEQKTTFPSLMSYIKSDLFNIDNISKSVNLLIPDKTNIIGDPLKWESVISYLPLEFYQLIESYPDMFTVEEFDKKYVRNPKLCAYERYGTTNMWRPLMILNRCPSIVNFDFKFIRYYNIATFSNVLSVLISRVQKK